MNLRLPNMWQRLKNLWALSGYEVPLKGETPLEKWAAPILHVFNPPQATVIPYKPRDPAKEIIDQAND